MHKTELTDQVRVVPGPIQLFPLSASHHLCFGTLADNAVLVCADRYGSEHEQTFPVQTTFACIAPL